jgi:hypothetical protein
MHYVELLVLVLLLPLSNCLLLSCLLRVLVLSASCNSVCSLLMLLLYSLSFTVLLLCKQLEQAVLDVCARIGSYTVLGR